MRPDPRSLRIVPWYEEPTAQVISDCRHHDEQRGGDRAPAGPAPDPRCLRRARLAPGGGARARVLPDQDQRGSRLSARAAGRPLETARIGAPELRHRCGQRVRPDLRGRLPLVRGAGDRHRHPDPRVGRRADGDQLQPRRPAGARRPGVPVQAHAAPGRAQARHLRHLHGQADGARAGQRDARAPERVRHRHRREPVRQGGRRPHRPVPVAHRRPAEIPAGGDAAARPERQLVPAPAPLLGRADQPALGLGEPHGGLSRARLRPAPRAGSRTGSPAPMPTPTSRSPARSPAACSA